MAAVPSQRRGLPQPYASQGQQKENTPQLALSNRPDGTTPAAAVTVTIETSEHSKRASPAASMPVTTAVAAGGLAGTAPAFRQPANGSPAPNPQRGTQSRGGKSPYARPAAATFPWSSRPDPAVVAHGPSYPEKQFNVGAGVQQPPHHHHSHHFSAVRATGSERAATPDSQRRGFVAHANAEGMLHHSPPPQQQQQRLASSPSPYAEPSIHDATPPQQQPGTSSSLVFALSEDSELQVLASRVGPTKPAGTAPRTSDGTAAAATQPSLAVSRAGQLPAAGVTGAAAAAAAPHHHLPLPPHATPHTPGVYRSLSERTADEAQAVAGSKPSVQVAYPPSHVSSSSTSTAPSSSAAAKPTGGAGAAMLYRSTPHDLPSPPALHVCPGAIPGTAAGQPGPTRAASSDSRAAPLPPPAAAAAVSSGAAARWSASRGGVPSVSLYAAYATGHPLPPPPRHYAASAGPEGSGGRGGRLSTARSVDGRSQHSGTPPPPPSSSSAAALAAGRPVEKNFTKAQQEAVLAEVQQELFLNYTAVPVPAHMVNSGDTDERRRRLEQRQKQILYGKETDGYATYTTMVPRPCDREYHNPLHAITPRPEYDCSKRQFDRVLNAWRRQLHQWDECDLNQPEARFLPGGHATLLDLGLMAEPPAAHTPTPGDQQQQQQQTLPQQQQQQQPSGVMHSIANVAAMAHDQHHNTRDGDAAGADDDDDEDGVSHTRSPVFTGHTPTSGLYSNSLSMHLNSGRASAMTAAACTPSRPQLSEGGEGPQVDDSFFLHMNSANSRIASPYHPNYSGHGHPNAHASSAAAAAAAAHGLPSGAPNGSHHHHHGNGVASGGATPFHAYGGGAMGAALPANGRSSANSYYHQFMRNNSYAHHTGLTPAHRPPSRGAMPHHISAIFGSEFELMTPSGPGSPSGIPPIPRNGGSPYRLSEPWMPPPNRRSPTYQVAGAHSGAGTATASSVPSGIAAANSAGTMMLTGARGGESPPQTTELALIPSTSHSSGSGGFAQSPYGFRVHSPVQPQGAYATPVSRPQSRPGMAAAQPLSLSPSRSPIGLLSPQQQQEQRVAVATTTRSQRGSGVAAVPTSWTPPNTQVHVRPSPRTPQLHLAATPPSTKRPEGQ